MQKKILSQLGALENLQAQHFQISNLDLVVIKNGSEVSVLYGTCLHRGALLGDGQIGANLICGLHGWDYRYDLGVSEYNNSERLHKFYSEVKDGAVYIDADEIARACGHNKVQDFNFKDLSTTDYSVHQLTGIAYARVNP